jgi:hypothetical protein
MPMAKKLGAPIFRKKSEKYSTVSIELILSKNRRWGKDYVPNFGWTEIWIFDGYRVTTGKTIR